MFADRFKELVNEHAGDARRLLFDDSPYGPGWMAAVTVADSTPDYILFVASSATQHSGALISRFSRSGSKVSIPGVTGDTRACVEWYGDDLCRVCVHIGSLTIETAGGESPVRIQHDRLATPVHEMSNYVNGIIFP